MLGFPEKAGKAVSRPIGAKWSWVKYSTDSNMVRSRLSSTAEPFSTEYAKRRCHVPGFVWDYRSAKRGNRTVPLFTTQTPAQIYVIYFIFL